LMGSPRPPAARMFIVPEGVTPEVPPLRPSLPAGSAIFVTLYHITDPRGFVQLSSLRGGYATRRRLDRVQRRAFLSHVPPAGYIPPPLGESAFVTTVAPAPPGRDGVGRGASPLHHRQEAAAPPGGRRATPSARGSRTASVPTLYGRLGIDRFLFHPRPICGYIVYVQCLFNYSIIVVSPPLIFLWVVQTERFIQHIYFCRVWRISAIHLDRTRSEFFKRFLTDAEDEVFLHIIIVVTKYLTGPTRRLSTNEMQVQVSVSSNKVSPPPPSRRRCYGGGRGPEPVAIRVAEE